MAFFIQNKILNYYLTHNRVFFVFSSLKRWYFVARFCFLSEQGQFEYYVEYSKVCLFTIILEDCLYMFTDEYIIYLQEYAIQNLLLYYDSENQWPSVYKAKKVSLILFPEVKLYILSDLVFDFWYYYFQYIRHARKKKRF